MSHKVYQFIVIQVAILATNLFAQVGSPEPSITSGSRVRIKVDSSDSWIIGNIQDIRSDSIYFSSDQKKFPIKSISKFELSVGKKLRTMQGGKIGLLIGAIGGAIAYMVISSGDDAHFWTAEEAATIVAITSVTLGGLSGLAVGSFIKTDQWQAIAVQDIVPRFIPKDELTTLRSIHRQKKKRRWSASAFLGITNSNVGSDIESALKDNAFEVNRFGGITKEASSSTIFALNYRLNQLLGVGLMYSQIDLGETVAWQALGQFSGLGSPIKSSAKMTAFLFSVNQSFFNAGIGPAIYLTNSETVERENKTTKLGAVAQVGLQMPHPYWPVFIEFKIQYRMVGSVEIGPFEFEAGNQVLTFPKTKVGFNHTFIAVGIGFKF
ncbi:MAG: hypothetical protein E2O79_07740 [Caldithrix sp.]|nr:MAG: hypothetical protein E2O79_07740 [Caldithrix sp.]